MHVKRHAASYFFVYISRLSVIYFKTDAIE
jgi:hypothetical protein